MLRRILLAATLVLVLAPALAQAPPPVPALPDTQRLTSYTLSASTCACAVGFALYGDGTDVDNWIQVDINGTRHLSTDPAFGWKLTSSTGPIGSIPLPITDAVLTFTNPLGITGTVDIIGARRPRRLSQFPENRGVTARDFNVALTDIVAQNRESWDKINSLLASSPSTTPGQLLFSQTPGTAPLWETPSGDVASVTVAGKITLGSVNGIPFTARSGNTSTFATVGGTLTAGNCLNADGAGNVVSGTGACVSSGSGVTAGTGGNIAQYATTGSVVSGLPPSSVLTTATATTAARSLGNRAADHVNVRDFGATCDGVHDDTAAFNSALAYVFSTAPPPWNSTPPGSGIYYNLPGSATIDTNGNCLVGKLTWPGTVAYNKGVSYHFRTSGTITVTTPTGLNINRNVTWEGTNIVEPIQFQSGGGSNFQYSGPNNATFTGTGSGTTLTVSSVTGTIIYAAIIAGTGVPQGTVIVKQLSGTPGGAGTYLTSHPTTSVAASITQGPVILDIAGSDALKNMTLVGTANGTNILIDGANDTGLGIGAGSSNVYLENVGSSAGTNGIPITYAGVIWVDCYRCRFLTSTNTGATILFLSDASWSETDGIYQFNDLITAGTGFEIVGVQLSNAHFSHWIHESGVNNMGPGMFNLVGSANLNNIIMDDFGAADTGTMQYLISNPASSGGCSNVVLYNSGIEFFPLTQNTFPHCTVSLYGSWQSQFGAGEALNLGTDNGYFEWHQNGYFDATFVGRGARFGPSTTPGKAITSITQDPSTWSALGSGVTVTTGVLAPDGTTNAAQLVTPGSAGTVTFGVSTAGWAAGGFVLYGYWARCDPGAGNSQGPNLQGGAQFVGGGGGTFTSGLDRFSVDPTVEGAVLGCTWRPYVGWGKIVTVDAGGTSIYAQLRVETNSATDFFMPWAIYVPPNTTTDDEIIRWTRHLSTVVSNAPQGSAGMFQPLFMDAQNPIITSLIAPNIKFSAAGTPLPTCNAGTEGYRAYATDITTATYRTAYVSGGANKGMVLCNGTSWLSD